MRRTIAVLGGLKDNPRECFIVTKSDCFGDAVFLDVQAQVEALGYRCREYGAADAGFLAKLYESSVLVEQLELDPESKELIDIIDNDLIAAGLRRGASDIHIEIRDSGATIYMRVHGVMTCTGHWALENTLRLSRVLFLLADEKTKGTSLSEDTGQSMSVKRVIKATTVKLRVQTESAYPYGKDIVIRLLPEGVDAKVQTLEALGYAPGHLMMLSAMLSKPKGAIIVAGTTGSGKSTTLQTMMHDIRVADQGIKLLAIEDPPEYLLTGVTQIPVRSGVPGAYTETMRNAMRMDPDVIMVGELRDTQAVELFTHMVQSGHKALTTLHASSSFGIIGRLSKMGLDLGTLSDNDYLSGLVFQTLVPVLCQHCRREYLPEEWGDFEADSLLDGTAPASKLPSLGMPGLHDRIRRIRRPGDLLFVRGNGCPHCTKGVTGRTVCAEMVLPTAALRAFLRDNNVNGAYEHWRSLRRPGSESVRSISAMNGMTALDHALHKMRLGVLSPVDLEASLGFLTGYEEDDSDDDLSLDL